MMRILTCLRGLLLGVVLVSGCTPSPPPEAPGQGALQPIMPVAQGTLFAGSPDGRRVALNNNGLRLYDIPRQQSKTLSPDRPQAIAWDDAGERLAAAFDDADSSTRVVSYAADGTVEQEFNLPFSLLHIGWSRRGGLLVTGYSLEVYSFGSNLRQSLYVLNDAGETHVVLGDTTLNPPTTRFVASRLKDFLQTAFSAQGNELLYTRLHDPPEFDPYLLLLYRNWQVDRELVVGQLPLAPLALDLVPGRDLALVYAEGGAAQLYRLWPQVGSPESTKALSPGERSPAGRYRLHNGQLLRDGEPLTEWSIDASIQFLRDGRFLLLDQDTLYLGDGLDVETPPTYHEKLWTLRRWLFQGLISYADYLNALKDIEK